MAVLDDLAASLEGAITARTPDLLSRKPVDRYIRLLDEIPTASYAEQAPETQQWCEEISREHGQATLESYHKLVLRTLMTGSESRAMGKCYPDSIRGLFAKEFQIITEELSYKSQNCYVYSQDQFCKDLGICRQILIPCGVQLAATVKRLPLRYFITTRVRHSVLLVDFVCRKLGSFGPLFNYYNHRRAFLEFNPDGWKACYLRTAELLQLNPSVRGVFGSSWWFDPKVAEVSPRFGFIRELPEEHGARVFNLGEDEESTQNALINSLERQRLHSAGAYKPKRYLMIWARNDLLHWAARER